jgi:gamma-glutamyltranspeptidase/glutathione hydrolase
MPDGRARRIESTCGRESMAALLGYNGAVTAGHPLAAQAGLHVLRSGGNAVDAAVATAAALCVVMPDMNGPLGYGFALVAMSNEAAPVALDMHGTAPRALDREQFAAALGAPVPGARARSGPIVRGPLSCLVPGNLRGWEAMLERHGRMRFAEVLGPAIQYAEQGRPVDEEGARHINRHVAELGGFRSWAETFLPQGRAPVTGQRLVMSRLAHALRLVAVRGADIVYNGELAEEIARFFADEGGWITREDLATYQVQWRAPIAIEYRDTTVYGVPPSASSITWMEALAILERFDLRGMGHNSVRYLHTLVEAMKRAYLDTFACVGDPDFVHVPIERLLGAAHATSLAQGIGEAAWRPALVAVDAAVDGNPVGSTTHLNVIDSDGNVVAMTNTLGAYFGGGMVAGNTGMLINDGMDWFDADTSPWTGKPSPTAVAPGKRPRVTLAPGLLYKRGKPWMAVGGAGAEATLSGILQPILNVLDFDMDAQQANDAARFRWGELMYYALGTKVRLEAGIDEQTRRGLAAQGHEIVPLDAEPKPVVGATNMIVYDAASGLMTASANSRGRDAAAVF